MILNIIQPVGRRGIQLLLLIVLNIAVVELGRKTLPRKEDVAQDTYSAHLGYRGTAFAVIIASLVDAIFSISLLHGSILFVLPAIALASVILLAFRYGANPNEVNQRGIEGSVFFMFIASLVSVILGT